MANNLHRISNEEIAVEIDLEHGGRISSLKWQGFQFALPRRDDPMSWGWFGMVPWAGRIDRGLINDIDGTQYSLPTHWDPPHAEHGYGFHSAWSATSPKSWELLLPEPYAPAIAHQRIELEGNTLTWSLEYIAHGCTLPAWVGFHPWFPRSIDGKSEIKLLFSAEKMLIRGDDYLPTGEFTEVPDGPWDDAFTDVRAAPIIRWGDIAQIQISSSVPWWVVYTEDPLGICVEPQTAPPDAANLGIIGSHSIEAKFTFTPLN